MILDGKTITINSTPTIDTSMCVTPAVAELAGTLTFTYIDGTPTTLENCKLYLSKGNFSIGGQTVTGYGIWIQFPYGGYMAEASFYNTAQGWKCGREITLNEITSGDMKTHRMVQFLMENSDYEPNGYSTNETELYAIANAIREKGGTTAALSFPDGFISAIASIGEEEEE